MLNISTPFPNEKLPLAWTWLHEHPKSNFDDYGPKTFEHFEHEMFNRGQIEKTWLVANGKPCGIVAYLPIAKDIGTLHGICFARKSCTHEQKILAMKNIFSEIFDSGVRKICASHFADNIYISTFLFELGFKREGILKRHTLRNGVEIDMIQVALFREQICR
jgi:RimJ/RimL family protein N-acetyltransferase